MILIKGAHAIWFKVFNLKPTKEKKRGSERDAAGTCKVTGEAWVEDDPRGDNAMHCFQKWFKKCDTHVLGLCCKVFWIVLFARHQGDVCGSFAICNLGKSEAVLEMPGMWYMTLGPLEVRRFGGAESERIRHLGIPIVHAKIVKMCIGHTKS